MTSRTTGATRVQAAIERAGHVCTGRCVVRGDEERHYGEFGELVAASLSPRDQVVLIGWTAVVTLLVAIEGWTLFR